MDNRKNNGNKGHSTKAKGFDKRKNQYKDVLNESMTTEELASVIRMLYSKAVGKQDIQAAKIIMEYYLGKPLQQTDVTSNGESISVPVINFTKGAKSN